MSLNTLYGAIEAGLKTLNLELALENMDPPSAVPHLEVFHLPAEPDSPGQGGDFRRELVVTQVNCVFLAGEGSGAALQQAELVQALFHKGSDWIQGGFQAVVFKAPHIGKGWLDADKYKIPVSISWYSNIYTP